MVKREAEKRKKREEEERRGSEGKRPRLGGGVESSVDDAALRSSREKRVVTFSSAFLPSPREEKESEEDVKTRERERERERESEREKATERESKREGKRPPVGEGAESSVDASVDQTIWARLEFEDGQIVPLKNSVSTSFYIGREPSPHEHNHRFYHEDDKLCRRISRAHCQILRLDTGSFSSYVLSLNIVLLILMKYVN